VYSNAVTEKQQLGVQAWLKDIGFKHKSTSSAHIHHLQTASSYTVSYIKDGAG
jgi:hypothetical protein